MTKPAGYVDIASHVGVHGWLDTQQHAQNPFVKVQIDGEYYTTVTADEFRQDLKNLRINGGFGGFTVILGLPLRSGPHRIEVLALATNEHLEGSPTTINPLEDYDPVRFQKETRDWLDERFSKKSTQDGIYVAHQPIYGFRGGYSELNWHERYLITYHIIRSLQMLEFETVLDAGGAEGYKASMIRDWFNAEVVNSDISAEACKRSVDIFKLPACNVDIHSLPFPDNSIDIVLASETLEHVVDRWNALDELLRVASKGVLVTVPHESIGQVTETIRRGDLHGHIQYFDCQSFDSYRKSGFTVKTWPILSHSKWIRVAGALMECNPDILKYYSPIVRFFGKQFPGLCKFIFNQSRVGRILEEDIEACRRSKKGDYSGVIALILKPDTTLNDSVKSPIRMREIMDYQVPYYIP